MKVDYRVRVLDVDSAKVLGKALTDVESDAMELTLPVEPFGVKLAVVELGLSMLPRTIMSANRWYSRQVSNQTHAN